MTDKSMKYSIDARQAEAGARQFVRAVGSIRTASKKAIQGTAEDFDRLSKALGAADFTSVARKLRAISRIDMDVKGLTNFVKAARELSSYKGPAAAAVSRTKRLAEAINMLGSADGGKAARTLVAVAAGAKALDGISNAAANMKTLKTALAGLSNIKPKGLERMGMVFQMLNAIRVSKDVSMIPALAAAMKDLRPPTEKRLSNLDRLFDILKRVVIPPGMASGLTRLSTGLAGFKVPTNSQIQRFKDFMEALNNTKIRADFTRFADAFNRIATASTRAASAMSRFRGTVTGLPMRRTTRQIHGMTGALRGLENAFSLSYHAGSAFRTMLGALSLGTFARSVFDTSVMFLKADSAFRVVTGSAEAATAEMGEAVAMIRRTGGAIDTVLPRYSKFVAAAGQSGLTVSEARDVFESVAGALTVLGANAEDSGLAFLAIEQILSKGVLSSEELRRQLAERLPGAFQTMAQALYPTIVATQGMEAAQAKLNEDLKAGAISSVEAMRRFSEVLRETYGPELENALKRPDVALSRLRNEWTFFKQTVADNGFMYELGLAFDRIAVAMQSPTFQQFAVELGHGLGRAISVGSRALVWMIENIDQVKTAIKAAISAALVFKSINLAGSLALSVNQIGSLARTFSGPLIASVTAATAGMSAFRVALMTTGIGALIVGLGTLAYLLYKNRDASFEMGGQMVTVGETVMAVFDGMKDAVLFFWNVSTFVSRAIWNAFSEAFTGMEINWGESIQWFISGIDRFGQNFMGSMALLKRYFQNWIADLLSGWARVANAVGLISDATYTRITMTSDVITENSNAAFVARMEELNGQDGWLTSRINQRRAEREANTPPANPYEEVAAENLRGLRLFEGDYNGRGQRNSDLEAQRELDNITRLTEKYLPLRTAQAELEVSEGRLLEARRRNLVNDTELAQAQDNLRREYRELLDPVSHLIDDVEHQNRLTRETLNMAPGAEAYYRQMATLRRENAEATIEENDAFEEQLRLQASLDRFKTIRDELNPLAASQRNYELDHQAILDGTEPGAVRDRMLRNLDAQYANEVDPRNAVQGYRDLSDSLNPLAAATAEYENQLRVLNTAQAEGLLVGSAYREAVAALNREHRDALDPVRAMRESYAEQAMLMRMNESEARRYSAVRDQLNTLEEQGVAITNDLVREVTELVAAQDSLENPTGFRQWIAEARTLEEAMSDLATTVGDELAGSFAKLFATGNFEITEFLTAIRDEAAQAAGDLLAKETMNVVGLGDKGGLIGGATAGLASLFDGVDGNFLSSFMGGFNQEKAPDGLSKGDTAIVDKLIEIRDALTNPTGGVMGGDLSSIFNNGGIFGQGSNPLGGLLGGGGGGLGGLLGGAGGGLGGLVGGIGNIFSGGMGGLLSSGLSILSSFFKEGGHTGAAVAHGMVPASTFANAQRYAVGTPNISSGEHPAILHDDEAVIPLSRGRYVPVKMEGGGGGKADNRQQVVNYNISTPDANSFGRSEHQLRQRAARNFAA